MTALAEHRSAPDRRPWARREARWLVPVGVGVLDAIVFAAVAPNVNDIFAATARASAVLHGVGLDYWFGWFGGGSTPGNYSVLTPYLAALVSAIGLAAIAAAATAPTAWPLLRDTTHPVAGLWVVVLTAGLNMWSGRVPFALGCCLAVATGVFVQRRRAWPAGLFALLTVASSPVSGAFLALILFALFVCRPDWRRTGLLTVAPIGAAMIGVALVFGQPGPESFTLLQLVQLLAAAAALLVVASPDWLRVTVWLTVIGAPAVFLIPNGLGDNLLRMVAYCLPAVVVATSRHRLRTALIGVSVALALSTKQSVGDVFEAAQPTASPAYYRTLIGELDRLHDQLRSCRLEVVDDGTHTASYALLDHAMLARGYEYQEDNALNAVLASPALDRVAYKVWLDNNAVCFVAIASSYRREITPEFRLVSRHRPPYLRPVWHDRSWAVYRVAAANSIVAPPVQVVRFSQSKLVLRVPCTCTFGVRVRKPENLRALTTPRPGSRAKPIEAILRPDGFGWATMTTRRPGVYTLSG
jgi:MFS family permease